MTDNDQKIDQYADKAHQGVDTAAAKMREVGEAAGQRFEDLKAEAGHYAGMAQDKLRGGATTGKDKAADALHGLADATRNTAEKITDPTIKPVADYAMRAADGLDRWSDALKTRSVDELGADLRTSVRENPMVAVGAAAVVGFVLARLFTSGRRA